MFFLHEFRTWFDGLEEQTPSVLLGALRVYRIAQQENSINAACKGVFDRAQLTADMAEYLGVSPETIRRALRKGKGIFWNFELGGKMRLIGFRRVYARFGVSPGNWPAAKIPIEWIKGNIRHFRSMIAAMKLRRLQLDCPELDIFRETLAKKLKVSVRTLHRLAKEGWVTSIPLVDTVGVVDDPVEVGPFEVRKRAQLLDDDERTWLRSDGRLVVIRQKINAWRSLFAKKPMSQEAAVALGLEDSPHLHLVGAMRWVDGRAVYTSRSGLQTSGKINLVTIPQGWS